MLATVGVGVFSHTRSFLDRWSHKGRHGLNRHPVELAKSKNPHQFSFHHSRSRILEVLLIMFFFLGIFSVLLVEPRRTLGWLQDRIFLAMPRHSSNSKMLFSLAEEKNDPRRVTASPARCCSDTHRSNTAQAPLTTFSVSTNFECFGPPYTIVIRLSREATAGVLF